MKKLLIPVLFLLLAISSMSQGIVYISGTVTDTATGNPIPNHAVIISNDSSSGWVYYHVVYTNNLGHYLDTVITAVPSGSPGTLFVRTSDCQNNMHQIVINYNPANYIFTADFAICNTPSPGLPILITGPATGISNTGVILHGSVNPNGSQTSVTFEFGTTTAYGNYLSCGQFNGNTLQPVTQALSNLVPGTLYHYRINGNNAYGTAYGFDSTFITLPAGSLPVAITNGANDITSSSATVHAIYNANGNSCTTLLEWGLTTSYGSFITGSANGYNYVPDQANLGGFVPNTTVHFRASIIYPGGTIHGADSTFTTLGSSGCHAAFTAYPISNVSYAYQFENQSSGNNISTYIWSFGDGVTQTITFPGNPNVSHTYLLPGTYTVCLTIHGNDSTCFDMTCDTLTILPVSPSIYLKIEGTVTNIITNTPMANHAVTWGTVDTLTAPHTIYTNISGNYADSLLLPQGVIAGNYYVWSQDCEVTSELSGQYNSFTNYHIHQDFLFNCETNLPCQANMKLSQAGILTVHFEDKSTGGVTSRIWDFGDGNTTTIENPVHTYSSQADYIVTLSTSNSITGCFSSKVKLIHFSDSLLCNASFSFTNTQNPRTIQFQDLSSSSNGIRSWYFEDSDTSSQSNPQHTFRYPGLYLVLLSVGNYTSTCWQTTSRAVLITDSLAACQSKFTYTISPVTGPKMVQFTDLSTGTPSQWHWDFGDGDSASIRYPIHSFAASGTYHVCLTITGSYCTSTYFKDLVIQDSIIYNQIYGQVFAGNFPVTAGHAMIVSFDTSANYQPFVEVFPLDSNGVYYFTMVPQGKYYILATPADSTAYIPAYYGNTTYWEQATLITLGTPNNPYNINLVPSGQMTSGPGSASGQINIRGLKSSLLDKMNMILVNGLGTPIGFTQVSASGAFSFPSLAYGIYYLHAEMPGITSDYVMINISPGQPHANVVMTFNGNKILGIPEEKTIVNHFSVYPNPVGDYFTVSLDMKQGTKALVIICNLTGQMIINTSITLNKGTNNITLSSASLPSGIYSLQIASGDGLILTTKIVKTR